MPEILYCHNFQNKICASCSLLRYPSVPELVADKCSEYYKVAKLIEGNKKLKVHPLVLPQTFFHSRTKAKIAVGGNLEFLSLGFPDRAGNVTNLDICPILSEGISSILDQLRELIPEFKITPYDVATAKGELKYIIIKESYSSKEILLRFVLNSLAEEPQVRALTQKLLSITSLLKVATLNLQPEHKAIYQGEKEIFITSQKLLPEEFELLSLDTEEQAKKISLLYDPQSFMQVTSSVAQSLYSYVAHLVKTNHSEHVLDLYCGVGGFSQASSFYAKNITGVEVVASAVNAANLAVKKFEIKNCEFICADVLDFLKTESRVLDTIIVNPPRAGLNLDLVNMILKTKPRLLIYSSCNPKTLLRDIQKLSSDYTCNSISGFDMFPLTEHLEIVAELKLK